MSVGGLVSGLDTTTLVSQLVQAEAAPQTALKKRLATAETAASAYRTVNTTFAAVRAAAEALTASSLASARTATPSSKDVTASAAASAVNGSTITFSVRSLAKAQVSVTHVGWGAATDLAHDNPELAGTIEILAADGVTSKGTVEIKPGMTLAQAAAAINDTDDLGVRASVVKIDGSYRLQFTSEETGTENGFTVRAANETAGTAGAAMRTLADAVDAEIDLGDNLRTTSSSNTFADLIAGVSVTVSKVDPTTSVTVTVGSDSAGVAGKVQTLVDAVNSALNTVKTYTSNAKGSTAALKGDFPVTQLAGRLLDAVSYAVGSDGSPAQVGLQLTRDGKISFDKAKFTAALEATPELAQRMIGGAAATTAPDGTAVPAVTGIAERLLSVARTASDSTTGSLVKLAAGKDSVAEDLQDRIDAWDLRLAARKEMLTRQFTAMETALSSLQNQSTWLAGQISSLPRIS
ncbi:flagellar filament capping protein FliD [Geodermatophilus sp. YIM 151500]|uniref:flagellar filament capping protein FliD n=1 Tax=Geodermatophilus sp. YIM 151500 TaxID=2984531 RepID=UPI0021E3F322|nr:flagellar filament capping protein FliD [Geodermatophilus sp. YIM 151500]MCV2489485.1 flagellar filament capping protein FliD [Geodermatophilus sp. YIM 151500]